MASACEDKTVTNGDNSTQQDENKSTPDPQSVTEPAIKPDTAAEEGMKKTAATSIKEESSQLEKKITRQMEVI